MAPAFRLPSGTRREPVVSRGHTYHLRASESQALQTVGTFRVVFERDLAHTHDAVDRRTLAEDLESLVAQGLAERRSVAANRAGRSLRVVALTPAAHHLLDDRRAVDGEGRQVAGPTVYSGWTKPRELVHDASLYRMYLVEAERIHGEGGVIRRVVLDAELKQRLYQPLNRGESLSSEERHHRLAELAAAQDLPVVNGHVQLPDLRIEYDTREGDRTKVDVELTTEAYRAGQLAAKRQAGFTVYSASGHGGRSLALAAGSAHGSHGAATHDRDAISGLLSL